MTFCSLLNNGRMMRFCEYVDVAGADSSSDDNASEDNSTDNDALTQDTASASDDADESGDDDNISDAERIAREREVLARYLPVRKSGGGVRPRGRASGTNKGIKLMDGAKLAAMIVVPVERIEDEKLNYLIITESGIGKRGRLISLPGKVRRGGMGNWVCSAAARSERVVGVITADESSDYLIFSNTGSVLRSRVSDLTVRSRSAGYLKLKRCTEGELIVGMQEIPPAVVAEINESAEARAAEKRRVENGEDAVVTDPLANATSQDETNAQAIDTAVDSNEDNGATDATDAQNNTDI